MPTRRRRRSPRPQRTDRGEYEETREEELLPHRRRKSGLGGTQRSRWRRKNADRVKAYMRDCMRSGRGSSPADCSEGAHHPAQRRVAFSTRARPAKKSRKRAKGDPTREWRGEHRAAHSGRWLARTYFDGIARLYYGKTRAEVAQKLALAIKAQRDGIPVPATSRPSANLLTDGS